METTYGLKKIIALSVLAMLLMITVSNAVIAGPVSLNVPIYKQGDSRWSEDKLGSTSLTIGNSGCAITSIAMVFKYYGVQIDPKDLNSWLTQNGGYTSDGKVYWSTAAGRSGGTVQYSGIYDYTSVSADLNKINSELDNGYPVIAEVRLFGSQHFVVINGYSGTTYYINDPYYGTNSMLSDHYGSNPTSAIYRIVLYHGTPSGTTSLNLIPIAGDMYGNDRDITGTFNPSTMEFSFNGKTVNFGSTGDLPVIGDWNGDSYDEIGVYRPNQGGNSYFYLITRHWNSLTTPVGSADKSILFGSYPNDVPIVGDWNGDGKDDVGGFYPDGHKFYLYTLDLGALKANPYKDVSLGNPGDIPLAGDWNGDGRSEIGIFRYPYPSNPNTNAFYFIFDLNNPSVTNSEKFGDQGDSPVIGDWDGDKYDTIGVYRQVINSFFTDNNIPKNLVPKPPVADFSALPSPVYVNNVVSFTDKSTGLPTSWSWDFGDGGTSSDPSPTHTYTIAGTYIVTLTVSNSVGTSSPKTVQINVIQLPQKPVAEFSTPAPPVYVNDAVTFTDKSTGSPTSWSWDFGDGGTSSDPSPTHTYNVAGTYTVTLTVSNSAGTSSPKTAQINVIPRPQKPIADFSANPTSGSIPLTVSFTDKSTGSPTSWVWTFGDGGTSNQQNTTHVYTAEGTYTVTLTANNSAGASSPKTAQITVIQLMPKTVNISFNPQIVELHKGSSKTIQIVMDKVPANGLAGFNITISVLDPAIANISAVSPPSWAGVSSSSTVPSSSVWITAANFGQVHAGDINVSFGNITITGLKAGTTNLSIVPTEVDDLNGGLIDPDVTLCKVRVVLIPPLPGCSVPPKDLDNDGLYEDINGNGRLDFADVVTYFNCMQWIKENSQTVYFDFNHNGRIDFSDVVILFNMH